jgi:putative transcriptional regulator
MMPLPHHHPEPHHLRAHASGQADVPLRLLVEAHLGLCAACAREVARLGAPGAALLESLPAVPLPPGLFERALAEARRRQRPRGPRGMLPEALQAELPAPHAWRWRPLLSGGGRVALLMRDAHSGSALYGVHLPPGARMPRHSHRAAEQSLVLSGGVRDGARLLEAGDWSDWERGSAHTLEALPDEGCQALSRVEHGGVRWAGWRGLLQRLSPRHPAGH